MYIRATFFLLLEPYNFKYEICMKNCRSGKWKENHHDQHHHQHHRNHHHHRLRASAGWCPFVLVFYDDDDGDDDHDDDDDFVLIFLPLRSCFLFCPFALVFFLLSLYSCIFLQPCSGVA